MLNESSDSSPQLSAKAARVESWRSQTLPAASGPELRDWVAQLMKRNDRRKNPRLAQPAEIRIQQLTPTPGNPEPAILGQVQNFSCGGMCIETSVPLVTSSVVQCRVGLPELQFSIPTLLQVMWVEEADVAEYTAGLRYVL